MEKETLRSLLKNNGYKVRFNKSNLSITNDSTDLLIRHHCYDSELMISFELDGPHPNQTIIDSIIEYFEPIASSKNLTVSFDIEGAFYYRKNDYFFINGYHRKDVFFKHQANLDFFKAIYDLCLEEEKKDDLFDFSFQHNEELFFLDFYKTGMEKSLVFDYSNHKYYVREEHLEYPFPSINDAKEFLAGYFDKIYRANRMNTLFKSPTYYSDKFFDEIGIYEEESSKVFQYLCDKNEDAETVERYFKYHFANQLPSISLDSDSHLLFLAMGTWVVCSDDEIHFYSEEHFDEALEKLKTVYFEDALSTESSELIKKIKQKRMG